MVIFTNHTQQTETLSARGPRHRRFPTRGGQGRGPAARNLFRFPCTGGVHGGSAGGRGSSFEPNRARASDPGRGGPGPGPDQARTRHFRPGSDGPEVWIRTPARPPAVDPRAQSDLAGAAQRAGLRAAGGQARDAPERAVPVKPQAPVPVPTLPLYPDRTQHHRDVRKELQETTLTAPLPQVVGQILERAFDLSRHRHPL